MPVPETNEKTATPTASLYESDFYAWTQEQASLLRKHQWSELDLLNLIEEIESLGKRQRQELRNRLSVLIGYLLNTSRQSPPSAKAGRGSGGTEARSSPITLDCETGCIPQES